MPEQRSDCCPCSHIVTDTVILRAAPNSNGNDFLSLRNTEKSLSRLVPTRELPVLLKDGNFFSLGERGDSQPTTEKVAEDSGSPLLR